MLVLRIPLDQPVSLLGTEGRHLTVTPRSLLEPTRDGVHLDINGESYPLSIREECVISEYVRIMLIKLEWRSDLVYGGDGLACQLSSIAATLGFTAPRGTAIIRGNAARKPGLALVGADAL